MTDTRPNSHSKSFCLLHNKEKYREYELLSTMDWDLVHGSFIDSNLHKFQVTKKDTDIILCSGQSVESDTFSISLNWNELNVFSHDVLKTVVPSYRAPIL